MRRLVLSTRRKFSSVTPPHVAVEQQEAMDDGILCEQNSNIEILAKRQHCIDHVVCPEI
jgi:hypothetical protein